MASKRHTSPPIGLTLAEPEDDAFLEQVLDAVRASVLAVGLRRTTLTDVARRAGVSRMTLYRRWPDVRTLVSDVMTREWTRLIRSTAPATAGTTRERIVEHLTVAADAVRRNALFRRILDVDPEVLLTYVLDRRGSTQDVVLELLEAALVAGHADGSVHAGDARAQARMLLLAVQSYVLSADAVGGGVPRRRLGEELRRLVDTYLAP